MGLRGFLWIWVRMPGLFWYEEDDSKGNVHIWEVRSKPYCAWDIFGLWRRVILDVVGLLKSKLIEDDLVKSSALTSTLYTTEETAIWLWSRVIAHTRFLDITNPEIRPIWHHTLRHSIIPSWCLPVSHNVNADRCLKLRISGRSASNVASWRSRHLNTNEPINSHTLRSAYKYGGYFE